MSNKLELLNRRLLRDTKNELEFGLVLNEIAKHCLTNRAVELCSEISAFNDIDELKNELDTVYEISLLLRDDRELPLGSARDIDTFLKKSQIHNSALDPLELLKIKDNLRAFRLVFNFISSIAEEYVNLKEISTNIHFNHYVEKHIEEAIEDNGDIKDDATKELYSIRKKILSTSDRLRNRLESIMKKTFEDDLLQEDFYTLREERFVIPVKTEFKRQIPGIIHGLSNTGNTVYLEPSEIIELNNSLSVLKNEEKKEINRILTSLTKEVGKEAKQLEVSNSIIYRLDLSQAKAKYSKKYDGFKPEITDDKSIELKDIYHPLLVKNKDKSEVTPLSISFDVRKQGHLISGPNAGGKTVALKNIGLNLLMAMSGIYPLGYCKTGLRDIYTSIGDHQSIEMDLSTFSSQMKNIKDVLDVAKEDSLFLVDEICSGTDPQEGSALASGILDTTLKYNLKFVVTTHQSSLKTYALNKENIENASLEFDEENLKPTYQFLPGVPGNSYAFNLAESIGLSQKIIERSKSYLNDKSSEIDKGIAEIIQYRKTAEKLKIEAEKSKNKAKQKQEEYDKLLSELRKNKANYKEEAKRNASSILDEANKLIENTIREVQENKKQVGDIKKEFDRKKNELKKSLVSPAKSNKVESDDEYQNGDSVRIDEYDTVGELVELIDNGKSAIVEFNGLKFKTKVNKLTKIKGKSNNNKTNTSNKDYIKFDVETRLDIRGERVNDAIAKVESFLNDAIVAGTPFITILHGKGTGALRSALHEYLNIQSAVTNFRDGNLSEGGSGVTIIEIK
jgi:DNA mismatch repair protein MutS2